MRRLILSAILFISMSAMAFAQHDAGKRTRKTPEEKAKHLTAELNTQLRLSSEQQSKVYAITLEGLNAWKKNHQKGDKAAKRAELQRRDAQISAVLNNEQRKTYQNWKAEKLKSIEKHGKKSGKRSGGKSVI